MNEMNNSDYLYHYTSIESLALILKNRTIRLNPLDKMDDLQEQETADVKNLGRFVFVSSWTEASDESIPMWKMYTNPSSGVRIKLRRNPFIRHGTSQHDFVVKLGASVVDTSNNNIKIDSFLNLADIMSKGFYSNQAWDGNILRKIVYTDDQSLLKPHILDDSYGDIVIQLGKLGLHKNRYWEFQNEWRYIMRFIPLKLSSNLDRTSEEFNIIVNKMAQGLQHPPFLYYDLDISIEAFSNMEITCSPQMSIGNRVVLEALIEKYNPKATIKESVLLGKI